MTHPDLNPRLPDLMPHDIGTPQLSAARLDALISHALAQPQLPQYATRPTLGGKVLAFLPRHRLAVSGGGMALAASLALAVVLFHNAPANISTGIANATAYSGVAGADNLKDVSDMMTLDVLDAAI